MGYPKKPLMIIVNMPDIMGHNLKQKNNKKIYQIKLKTKQEIFKIQQKHPPEANHMNDSTKTHDPFKEQSPKNHILLTPSVWRYITLKQKNNNFLKHIVRNKKFYSLLTKRL